MQPLKEEERQKGKNNRRIVDKKEKS